MALRLYSEFTSLNIGGTGVEWRIEIHDASQPGSVEFKVSSKGFEYRLEGENQNKYNPILPSSITFDMLVYASNESFLDSLIDAQEERFTLKITKNGVFWWAGFIINDVTIFEDVDYPYLATITAVDGLTRLQAVDYKNGANDYTGRETIIQHLINCLNKINLTSFFGTKYLKTINTWFDANHTAGTDPLLQTTIDHGVFTKKDKNNNTKYTSCYDVLRHIAETFAARIYMSIGIWRFTQVNEYEFLTHTEYVYNSVGTAQANESNGFDLAIIQGTINQKKHLIRYYAYPPLRKSIVTYQHLTTLNRLQGVFWDYQNQNTVILAQNLAIPFGESVRIRFAGELELNSFFQPAYVTTNGFPYHRYEFAVKIVVGAAVRLEKEIINVSSFYTANYGQPEWAFQDAEYKILSPVITEDMNGQTQFFNIDIESPELYNSGQVTVQFKLNRVFDAAGNEYTHVGFGDTILTWWLNEPIFQILSGNQIQTEQLGPIVYTATNSTSNSQNYERTIRIGDGPEFNSISRLANTDIIPVDTTQWTRQTNAATEAMPIGELLAHEISGGHSKPVRIMQGTLISPNIHPHSRLIANGYYYMMSGASFNAQLDEWTGEWFVMAYDKGPIVTEEPEIGETGLIFNTNNGGGILNANSPLADLSPEISTPVKFQPQKTMLEAAAPSTFHLIQQAVTSTFAYIKKNETLTTIQINQVDVEFIRPGDEIEIINPATNYKETLTLSNRYTANTKVFEIESHQFQKGFPQGSLLSFPAKHIANRVNNVQSQLLTSQTGSTTAITDFELPDPANYTAAQINNILEVYRDDGRKFYNINFTIDVAGSNNNLVWTIIDLDNENVFVKRSY